MTFEINDKVKLNQRYFDEGQSQFGREFKYPRDRNHFFIVKDIKKIDEDNSILVIDGKYKAITEISNKFVDLY